MAIRREKVVLSLQDDFTAPTLRAAAAAGVLDQRLGGLDRTTISTNRNIRGLNDRDGIPGLERNSRPAGREIDRLSGRLRLLASLGLAVGPAFVPVGAVAVPALTGLASALSIAALATGGAVLAFQGVGDALETLNKARLEPTEANLDAARKAMAEISPEARSLVRELSDLKPVLDDLQAAGGRNLFPRVEEGLQSLLTLAPQVDRILAVTGRAAGDIFKDSAESLASGRWEEFFDFLEDEARPTMMQTARTAGDLTHGLTELWMAFEPANAGALSWLAGAADDFDRWATELDQTEGFQDFLAYLDQNGPQVADTLGAIAGAAIDLTQATAPLGGPSLRAIEAVADAVSLIADSPFGPILVAGAAGMSALNLAGRTFTPVVDRARTSVTGLRGDLATMGQVGVVAWARNEQGAAAYAAASERVRGRLSALAKGGAQIGGLALASSDAAREAGAMNTALLATAGSMAGPWGTAVGGGIGLLLDFKARQEAAAQSAEEFRETLDAQTGAITQSTRELALNKLQQADWLDSAREAGITANELARAVLYGGDAYELAAAKIDDAAGFTDIFTRDAEDLKSKLRDMHGEVRQGAADWEYLAPVLDEAGGSADGLATALGHAAWESNQLVDAQRRLQGFLSRRGAWRAWQASIDEARKSLKDNGKTLDENTAKGRANNERLDEMIRSAATWSERLKGSNRERFASQARQDILQAARDMGATKDQLDRFRRALQLLDGQTAHTSVINTVVTRQQRETGVGGPVNPNAYADGGMVRGPGGPRDDRVPAWLSNGEYVINAAATSRHRALLDRINARRYADGGLVERTHRAGHQAAGRGALTVTVPSAGATQLVVSGVLDTPWGPAQVEGVARAAAREEISAEKEFDHMLEETRR